MTRLFVRDSISSSSSCVIFGFCIFSDIDPPFSVSLLYFTAGCETVLLLRIIPQRYSSDTGNIPRADNDLTVASITVSAEIEAISCSPSSSSNFEANPEIISCNS